MPSFQAPDGTTLFYVEWGQGEPLLFLNGLGCASRMWDYQFAAFQSQGFRCISFDRRGHGRSDQPVQGYDYDTFADDIAALIRSLGLKRVTLIGHSMASGEIVRYLSRHGSERIARAILLAPTTPKLLKCDDNPHGVPREQFDALWEQWRRDYPAWVDDNLAPFFVPETSPAMMRWGASLLQISVPVALECGRVHMEADFRAEMERIELPILIVHGDRDRSAPIDITAKASAELLPNSRLLVYPGAPHGLMFTHGDQLHTDILGFIRET
jgi:non-heme chloroperoxidase